MTPIPLSVRLRRRRRSAGFSSIAVLFVVSLTAIAALVLIATSLFQVRTSVRGENRSNALMLAEAGIDDAVQRMQNNLSYAGTQGAAMTMFEDPGTNSRAFGNFDTTVTRLSDTQRRITSVGRTSNGTTTTVHALVNIETRPLGSFAAIAANGNVTIGGTADIKTVDGTTLGTPLPPKVNLANAFANGNVSMGGSSTLDGQLQAVGSVSGTVNAVLGGVAGVPAFPFPSTATTDAWRTDWISRAGTAQSPPQFNGNNRSRTINAPANINGNIRLNSGETLELRGPGVVYVSGSINIGAQATLINGATLVVNGTFEQQGQAVYRITPVANPTATNPTPSLTVYGGGATGATNTLTIAGGGATVAMGIVYAVNGSIQVNGTSTFVGALVAGGAGSQINATGTYQHLYPNNMAGERQFDWGARVVGITEP